FWCELICTEEKPSLVFPKKNLLSFFLFLDVSPAVIIVWMLTVTANKIITLN
ncbi:hypothetical protein ACJX0J_038929, partial [Zea mays]